MILPLTSQLSSLEWSERLKALGVRQDSQFHHYKGVGGLMHLGTTAGMLNGAVDIGRTTAPQFKSYAAYTLSEVGTMLPPQIHANGELWDFTYEKSDKGHEIVYRGHYKPHKRLTESIRVKGEINMELRPQMESTEVDALCAMLAYLIEGGFISKTNSAVFGGEGI